MQEDQEDSRSSLEPSPREIVVGILSDGMLKLLLERKDGRKRRHRCQVFRPPSKYKSRVGAGGDDQVHPWRQMVEQKGDGIVNRLGFDNVVVVEDEAQVVWEARDFIEQGGQNQFDVDCPRGLKRGQ